MNRKLHPLTGATYELGADGNVHVGTRDGQKGVFTVTGRWIAGDLRLADPHLCGWVGGPRPPDPAAQGPAPDAAEAGGSR